MRSHPVRWLAIIVTAAMMVFGWAPSTARAATKYPPIPAGPITFCVSYPESGANAAFGSTAAKSAAIIQKWFNSHYSIAGHKIGIQVENDESSATEAVNIAQQFVSEHDADPSKCPVVTQLSQDPETAPLQAAILNKAKIIITASQSPDEFFNVKQFPYFFSVNPPDRALGNVAAHYLVIHNLDKIAVLTDNIPQETEYINDMLSTSKAMGGKLTIIKTASISPGAVAVQTQLAELKASNPQVLMVATEYGFGPIWSALHAMGWSPKIMGDVGFFYDGYNALGSLAPNAVAPCWYGNQPGNTVQTLPANVTAILNQVAPIGGGADPDALIATMTSINQLFLAQYAIQKADTLNTVALKSALETLRSTSLFFPGNTFTETPSAHSGLDGTYGAGICQAAPLGKMGNNNANFIYAGNYRAPAGL